MKTVYVDAASRSGCWSVIVRDAQVVQAGTTVYSMPASDRNAEYERWAEEYDIHFIFDDDVPSPSFYAVPRFDVLAVDSAGGYIGTIGQISDLQDDAPVGYIDRKKNAFLIARSGEEFMRLAPAWKGRLMPFDGIKLYGSKAEAEAELEFLELPELE